VTSETEGELERSVDWVVLVAVSMDVDGAVGPMLTRPYGGNIEYTVTDVAWTLLPLLAPVDPFNLGDAGSADDDDGADEFFTGHREARVGTTLCDDKVGVVRPVTGVDFTAPLKAGVEDKGEVTC